MPNPGCDCPTCKETARVFVARFHCRIGSCQQSFATAAAANHHYDRDHADHCYHCYHCYCRACTARRLYCQSGRYCYCRYCQSDRRHSHV
jgi:hypothetical protein